MSYTAINPAQYDDHLKNKCESLQQQFASFGVSDFEVFASSKTHYRQRAEFRVWHEGEDLYHIMFDPTDKSKIRIEDWLPGGELIHQLMPILIEELKQSDTLRRKLFQIDYLSTLSGEILVSLLYHRPLDEQWTEQIKALKTKLGERFNINFVGRARKQKILIERDYVDETLSINGKSLHYRQVENSFTQPNASMNQQMIEWAIDVSKGNGGDLLELYCGNGNFSLAMAAHFDKVLATEISKSSVASAQHNIAINNIKNVDIIRMSSEDFTEAMEGKREFKRLKQQDIDLQSYNCQTILVDPPRSGLDKATEAMVAGYDNIIYISCNPETLKDNLTALSKTHNVKRFAFFDQFPYTHHMESGVYLTKK